MIEVEIMLISFSLKNFRSFEDEEIIEMMPGKSRSKSDHIKNDCLPIAVIYGNNASGKSNLIRGLKTMKDIVTDKFYHGKEPLTYWNSTDNVTRFCVEFIINGLFYRYVIEVASKRPTVDDRFYTYPILYEHLSFADTRYESDKNGNIPMSTVLERSSEGTDSYWFYINGSTLYKMNKLIACLDRCNRNTAKQEIRLLKETNPESEDEKEELNRKRERNNRLKMTYRRKYDEMKETLNKDLKNSPLPSTLLDCLPVDQYTEHSKDVHFHLKNVKKWFSSCLCILDTSDIYIPEGNIESLSTIIKQMDLGIDHLEWKKMNHTDSRAVLDLIPIKDRIQIDDMKNNDNDLNKTSSFIFKTNKGIYKSVSKSGFFTIEELITVHSDGRKEKLYSESDGTVRMVELASILATTNDDVTFVVDEMDRRLHPMLTRMIVNSHLKGDSPSKQLIFTTHETEILTTILFRKDEIWFVEKNKGCSRIISLDMVDDVNYNRRLERLYLEDMVLPGAPRINIARTM